MAFSLLAYGLDGGRWSLFVLLFLAPDLSMLAYLAGPRWGGIAYNLLHAMIGPALLAAVALVLVQPLMIHLALIWFAHIGFDRMLGYGLKSHDSFHRTHMGLIGKARTK